MPLLLRSEEHTSELQSPCNLVCRFCLDRKSTRLNSSHLVISYAVFCLKKKSRTCPCPGQDGCGTPSALRIHNGLLGMRSHKALCNLVYQAAEDAPGGIERNPFRVHRPQQS